MPFASADPADLTGGQLDDNDIVWIQHGDDLALSGSDCIGENAIVVTSVETAGAPMSEWRQIPVGGNEAGDTLDGESGEWTAAISSADVSYSLYGGNYVVGAACYFNADNLEADADADILYDLVHLAVTGAEWGAGNTGEDVDISAYGFTPGDTVTITLSGLDDPIGTGDVDADGVAETTMNIPDTVEEGDYTLTITDEHGRTFAWPLTIFSETEEEPTTPAEPETPKMPDQGTDVI